MLTRWIRLTLLFMFIQRLHSSVEESLVPDVCQDGRWKECTEYLSTMIWKKFTWDDEQPIDVCKVKCFGKLTGGISRFRWVWEATFQCDGKAPGILGRGQRSKSRREAMQQAIAQTLEEAIEIGYLTIKDLLC